MRAARGSQKQEDVAQAIGVDQPTVSRWENDQSRPSFEQVSAFEEATGRPKGYCWIAAGYVDLPAGTRETIEMDPALEPGYRDVVVTAYEAAVARSATERARTSATNPSVR